MTEFIFIPIAIAIYAIPVVAALSLLRSLSRIAKAQEETAGALVEIAESLRK